MRRIPRLVRKVIGITILAGLGAFVLLGVMAHVVVPQTPPTVKDAPWLVQTSSLIYYAKEYALIDRVPTIRDFWTLDGRGKRYAYHEGEKSFPAESYGKVSIIRRTGK